MILPLQVLIGFRQLKNHLAFSQHCYGGKFKLVQVVGGICRRSDRPTDRLRCGQTRDGGRTRTGTARHSLLGLRKMLWRFTQLMARANGACVAHCRGGLEALTGSGGGGAQKREEGRESEQEIEREGEPGENLLKLLSKGDDVFSM